MCACVSRGAARMYLYISKYNIKPEVLGQLARPSESATTSRTYTMILLLQLIKTVDGLWN